MATIHERVETSVGGLGGRVGRQTGPNAAKRRLPPVAFQPRRRFVQVAGFFLRMVLHIYFWDVFLARFFLTRWYVRRSALRRWRGLAREFRLLAIRLGGMQIKLGQFLSSRADILPEAVTQELAGLQDEVPAAPTAYMLDTIMAEFGAPPEEVFASFETQAVAAASLGQVHYATLHDGREVAVKVQRPRIGEIIEVDLSAVALVVRLIKNYPPIRRRANLEGLLEEFGQVLRQELDYEQEAINGKTFAANFADVPGVAVPHPLVDYSTKRVLVMERISGVKINDFAALEAAGVSRRELADRLNSAYLKQFFLDGFFHADPHPGNLFVRVEQPLASTNGTHPPSSNGVFVSSPAVNTGTPFTLVFIDFGMVGRLPPKTMNCLRDAVVGVATNDAERMVKAFAELGAILPGADQRLIVQAFQTILRFAYDRTVRELNNLDVQKIMDETHDMVYDLPFQMPQDLIYVGRALSMVGGLATMIDPDINLFASLRPFTRKLIEREQRETDWAARIGRELQEFSQILVTLPRQMDSYFKAANQGSLPNRTELRLERGLRRVEQSNNRLAGGIVATGLFLGGVQLRTRGLEKDARRAWTAAAAAIVWSLWPRSDNVR